MFEQNRKYFLKYIKNNTEIITKLENFCTQVIEEREYFLVRKKADVCTYNRSQSTKKTRRGIPKLGLFFSLS